MSQIAAPAKLSIGSVKSPAGSSQNTPTVSATSQFFSSSEGRRGGSDHRHGQNASARNNQQGKPKHKSSKRAFRPTPDDDADAETFSMQNPHGRRGQQSITHLMQFSLPPRPTNTTNQGRGNAAAGRRKTWGLGSGYHAMDKARYINANYRFVVTPKGDYQAHAQDPDVPVDWPSVLQVIASAKTQTSSCPICLGEPTAPRMAKCGHIFCLPCLIRYLHSEDASALQTVPEKRARWKTCPICWDSVYMSDTRPVRWYQGNEHDTPREGHDVVLRLVKRKATSTLAMPRDTSAPSLGDAVPWHFAAEVMDYARIMKGSEQYMVAQYDEAIAAVETLAKEDELMFGDDTEWTAKAIKALKEAKEKIRGIGDAPEQPSKPISIDRQESVHRTSDEGQHAIPRTLGELRQRQTEKPQPAEYLFYHAPQHHYLSPLDIRILKAAFETYTSFPSSILPRVERVSSGHIVDDELRKRMKYLTHLPAGCEVSFLECDWTDTVSATILGDFEAQIEKRRTRNEEKESRDEKERLRSLKDAEKEYAALRLPRRASVIDKAFTADQLPTLSESMTDGSAPIATSPPWPARSLSGFASLASPSTSPSAHRTVWGTAAVQPTSPDTHATLPSDADLSQDDGWLQDWEKDLLAEADLDGQMDQMSINANPASKKAKKNKKKITLMSTTNARRGA